MSLLLVGAWLGAALTVGLADGAMESVGDELGLYDGCSVVGC